MSDIIKLLPDSVANQIAAGEVIQRPASVIKELVENSVDAGSSMIRIFIQDAGRTLIQVVDNGKGMSETDARMAFERHATSKINGADDLFRLSTMGFRGEALPSICAVSQVEIITKTKDAPIGTRIEINATKVENQEAYVCENGTNIKVKNLFFNVPARRKFLKADSVENSNIMREFERLALVNNNIHMSIDTGGKVLDLRPATLKNRIADIWKNSLDLHLIPVDVDTSLVKIEGYISRPEYARRRNPLQYLIVNGRNMRHPYFHKAIVSCYESLIASDTQPCYFLKFTVDPSTIDVNIHPTKNEIKFEHEQEIWPILKAAIKSALGKNGAVPTIDFQSDALPVEPLAKGQKPIRPEIRISPGYNPFESEKGSCSNGNGKNKSSDVRSWENLYADFLKGSRGFGSEQNCASPKNINKTAVIDNYESIDPKNAVLPEMADMNKLDAICIQNDERFIITSSMEGLIVIDQRKAHIKILFEDFLKHFRKGEKTAQPLMFPEILTLDPEHADILDSLLKDLEKFGFYIEKAGDEYKITKVCGNLKNNDIKEVITEIIDSVMRGEATLSDENSPHSKNEEKMALIMARSSALPVRKKLSDSEMEYIVSELFSLHSPMYLPNGQKTYVVISNDQLDNFFK